MGQGGLAIRTLRVQSGTNGSRTLGSILTGGNSGGAGSSRRMYSWYAKNNTTDQFYNTAFNLSYGKFRNNTQWFLTNS